MKYCLYGISSISKLTDLICQKFESAMQQNGRRWQTSPSQISNFLTNFRLKVE